MYKKYRSGHWSQDQNSSGHSNEDLQSIQERASQEQSARQAESVTEALISRGLSNLSVADLRPDNVEPETDPEIEKIVQQCWEEVDRQCISYQRPKLGHGQIDNIGWNTVRLFVSSTFTDFYCEREILVKKVFPELREWCRERMLYLVECDLRWGVPKDSTTSDAIVTCLEELDRCMEENDGQPFLLNTIGERYGWIPTEKDLPEDVTAKYSWVPNTSITFMEVLHGAYRMKSPNALFLLRDPGILKDISDTHIARYKDTEPLCREHLKHLKTRLQARFLDQVQNYSCQVEGIVTENDKEMVKLSSLEDFADKVLNFFKTSIERCYPGRDKMAPLSLIEEETLSQRRYVEEVSGMMLGREAEVQVLLNYALGSNEGLKLGDTKKPFSRDPKFWGEELTGSTILSLLGTQGYGKTTLMARVAQEAAKHNLSVFYHFCGSTGSSHKVILLLQRLVTFLSQNQPEDTVESIESLSEKELMTKLKEQLIRESSHGDGRKILLILDAVNQLSSSELINHLNWLPPGLPSNMRCIVSTTHHPPTVSRIQEHPHFLVVLQPLSIDDAKQIVQSFLLRYSKKLDEDQLQLILSSKCTQSPLWLYLVCEELRVYGDFRTLTKKVKTVSTSVEGMLKAVMKRLIIEDESGNLIKMLSLLACSNGTLTALDLQRMLGNIEAKEPLPMLTWTNLRRTLKAYLRISHFNEQIVFVHDAIRNAVSEMVINTREDKVKWNTVLADYIEYWCEEKSKKSDDLPYHLQQANLYSRLVHFLREVPESGFIPDFRRSRYLMNCRCRSLADPVIQKVGEVTVCTFCKMGKAKFHPRGYHRNENMCLVCGSMLHGPPFSHPAYLCRFHTPFGGIGPPKCFLCGNIAQQQSSVSGRLCQDCGFGNYGKQCIALDLKRT